MIGRHLSSGASLINIYLLGHHWSTSVSLGIISLHLSPEPWGMIGHNLSPGAWLDNICLLGHDWSNNCFASRRFGKRRWQQYTCHRMWNLYLFQRLCYPDYPADLGWCYYCFLVVDKFAQPQTEDLNASLLMVFITNSIHYWLLMWPTCYRSAVITVVRNSGSEAEGGNY